MNFVYPVPKTSIVTQTFQQHVDRARANGWQYYYGGIDWAVPTGTPIKAAQNGKVLEVRTDATGYGTHVRLQHDEGYSTIYAHLMQFSVAKDQTVKAGDVIGLSDNTGNSTGPHLHFELRKNNIAVDPAPLLVDSLSPGPGPGPDPDPGTTPGPEPAEWPLLPKARVVAAAGLNIRRAAGITNPIVGYLPVGTQVDVLRKTMVGPDGWLQIGHNQFVAQSMNGEVLAVFVV